MQFCSECEHINPERLFVFGRSLGGAVAIDVVSKHQDKVHFPLNSLFRCVEALSRWRD